MIEPGDFELSLADTLILNFMGNKLIPKLDDSNPEDTLDVYLELSSFKFEAKNPGEAGGTTMTFNFFSCRVPWLWA